MSCRAFARRIEHQCLRVLFETFDFAPTAKNGPLQEFFTGLLNEKPGANVSLKRETFESRCLVLYQTVTTL